MDHRVTILRRDRGFSVVELVIVLAVVLIVIAIAIPTMKTVIDAYRLDASGLAVASLLQQTRILAVKTNTPYYAQFDTTITPNRIYANTDQSAFQTGNSSVTVDGDVSFQTAGLPDHTQLDALMSNGNASAAATVSGAIGFNARGLPCVEQGGNPAVCTQPGNAANYFEWFMQDASNGGWEAVTVTPAGRIKAWRLGSASGCGYPACWQ